MAIRSNQWYSVTKQSLAIYARNAGFDLALYNSYDEAVQLELRKRTVKEAMTAIRWACEDMDFDLATVTKGVYVISLSNPLSIAYKKLRSQVIYIGRGNIANRIKSHFDNKLFDFMLSLSGADFDFHFAKPGLQGVSNQHVNVEHLMLEYFSATYGGLGPTRRFPILNKNAGNPKDYTATTPWWRKPLKASGGRPLWALEPTELGDFPPLDE